MKLKEEYVKSKKYYVYSLYERIISASIDYEDISKTKMLDSIIKEYNKGNFLYNICTKRELDFLKILGDKRIKTSDLKKYKWENTELCAKCILSREKNMVFKEQQENVKKALEFYEKNAENKENMDNILIFTIGYIRTVGNMLTKTLESMLTSMFELSIDDVNCILESPLLNFYCLFYGEYLSKDDKKFVCYRDYYDSIDEIDNERKKYGIGGSKEIYLEDYYDMFYYGFPMRNPKVKKMYDTISSFDVYGQFILHSIEYMRIFNNRERLDRFTNYPELLELVTAALEEIPCAVMNGFTPNEYKKGKDQEKKLNSNFTIIPQHNAHLCKKATEEFYSLYYALLDYTNKKYNIAPSLKKICNQEGLDINATIPIDDYLWEHKEEIIDDFISKNENDFTKEELDIINGFKNSISSECFVIVGFEREYTEILSSKEKKIYMVKGIKSNFDELTEDKHLPKVISTTLLMFKGNIVNNSIIKHIQLEHDNEFKELVLKEYNKATKCYQL